MHDPRIEKLAQVLTDHSTKIKKDENVLIDLIDAPDALGVALLQAVLKKGGVPFIQIQKTALQRQLYKNATQKQYATIREFELNRMKKMHAYIGVRGSHNIFETSDVPAPKMKLVMQELKDVLDWRVNKTKWVILRWPTPAFAQQCMMSTQQFEDLFFKVCTFDYAKFAPGMKALKALMDKTDRVYIKGKGVDLTFSIKGIGAVTCGGDRNIPDGEVFTAPVRDSVEGYIHYNTPTIYQGSCFDNVCLKFKKGKIIEAQCSNTKRLLEILDADPGARYIGEFAIGFNPHILHPVRDILFDEKIAGSFHFTPGNAYEIADNGNRSQVHWDMVHIQRKDYGGGEIYFDGKLIRKDGLFIPASLKKLNPDWLLA